MQILQEQYICQCTSTEKAISAIFVDKHNYSPQMNEKTDSKGLSLPTTAMDGGSAGFAGAKTGRFLF